MTELLLLHWDHATQSVPTPPTSSHAVLPKRFDLITAQPDGWNWGTDELTSPWFRIAAWPLLDLATASQFLSPLLPRLDSNLQPVTYKQYRAFFMDMTHAALPAALRNWWADDTRATPKLNVTISPPMIVDTIKVARPEILLTAP